MISGPPLEAGEEVVFDHIPSLASFRRTALIMLGITILPTVAFGLVFPGSLWVALPLFLTAVVLMQERMMLGRHRAWVTNQRIILQGGDAIELGSVTDVSNGPTGVRVTTDGQPRKLTLAYSPDPDRLVQAIKEAARR